MGKKDKLFYFPFYVEKWLSSMDVDLLTNAQQGAYLRLLCHYYRQDNITANKDILMKISGADSREDLEKILQLFDVSGEFLKQDFADTIKEKQKKVSKKRKKAAFKRWGEDANAMQMDMQNGCKTDANAMLYKDKPKYKYKEQLLEAPEVSEIENYLSSNADSLYRHGSEGLRGLVPSLALEFCNLLKIRSAEGNPIKEWKPYFRAWLNGQDMQEIRSKYKIPVDDSKRMNHFK